MGGFSKPAVQFAAVISGADLDPHSPSLGCCHLAAGMNYFLVFEAVRMSFLPDLITLLDS